MNTQNHFVTRWLSRFFLGSFLLATMLLVSCGDDPEPPNEEELITTLTVTLTPTGGAPITMTFKDLDGEGAGVPEITYSSGGDAAVLSASTTYTAEIALLDESVSPPENIRVEIEEEADEHLFCFYQDGLSGLEIAYADTEANYITGGSTRVVGLATTWTTTTTGEGTVTIKLFHQTGGSKTGNCPASTSTVETDIEVQFNIVIE